MDTMALARVLHVIGVVLWIGGVAMVTTVLLPAVDRFSKPQDKVIFFERIERRFAWQARVYTLITGLSGFYLLEAMGAWHRYGMVTFWWLHAMTFIWVLFTLMLFVLEPLVLHKWFIARATEKPEQTFTRIRRMHWILMILSLLTIAGAVAGSHGWFILG